MRNIAVLGNSGSGKSTLAKKLQQQGLAHLDLDTLAWQETSPPVRKPLEQSAAIIQAFIQVNDNWVIEGCYSDLLELVLPQANELIFMNLPIRACIENAKSRPWEPHKYASKTAQDKNLAMLIEWIAQYEHRQDACSLAAHLQLFDNFSGKKSQIKTNQS